MAYKIFYPIIPNMGDLLNKDMIEDVFNIEVEQASLKECDIIAIGSTLDHTMYSTDMIQRLKERGIFVDLFSDKGVCDMTMAQFSRDDILLYRGRELEVFSSVQDGDYSIERGAQKLEVSVKEFEQMMEDAGYKIPTY